MNRQTMEGSVELEECQPNTVATKDLGNQIDLSIHSRSHNGKRITIMVQATVEDAQCDPNMDAIIIPIEPYLDSIDVLGTNNLMT